MHSKQRVLATLRRQTTDRTPIAAMAMASTSMPRGVGQAPRGIDIASRRQP